MCQNLLEIDKKKSLDNISVNSTGKVFHFYAVLAPQIESALNFKESKINAAESSVTWE